MNTLDHKYSIIITENEKNYNKQNTILEILKKILKKISEELKQEETNWCKIQKKHPLKEQELDILLSSITSHDPQIRRISYTLLCLTINQSENFIPKKLLMYLKPTFLEEYLFLNLLNKHSLIRKRDLKKFRPKISTKKIVMSAIPLDQYPRGVYYEFDVNVINNLVQNNELYQLPDPLTSLIWLDSSSIPQPILKVFKETEGFIAYDFDGNLEDYRRAADDYFDLGNQNKSKEEDELYSTPLMEKMITRQYKEKNNEDISKKTNLASIKINSGTSRRKKSIFGNFKSIDKERKKSTFGLGTEISRDTTNNNNKKEEEQLREKINSEVYTNIGNSEGLNTGLSRFAPPTLSPIKSINRDIKRKKISRFDTKDKNNVNNKNYEKDPKLRIKISKKIEKTRLEEIRSIRRSKRNNLDTIVKSTPPIISSKASKIQTEFKIRRKRGNFFQSISPQRNIDFQRSEEINVKTVLGDKFSLKKNRRENKIKSDIVVKDSQRIRINRIDFRTDKVRTNFKEEEKIDNKSFFLFGKRKRRSDKKKRRTEEPGFKF